MLIMKRLLVLAILGSSSLFYSCSDATSRADYEYKQPKGDGIAVKVGDITITDKELYSGIESELFEAESKIFDIKFGKMNQLLIEKLIKKDPKSKGLSNDEYFSKYIATKVKVGDKEVDAFIKERKIPTSQVNPQVREKIVQYITAQKKEEALQVWLGEQTKKTPIQVFFEKPKRPVFDVKVGDAPFAGGKDAKVTIVEYSDFQCPYCSNASKVVRELKKKYGNKIKIAFKQFPLSFHTQAKKAAVAALCMNEQSTQLFWKMHDQMFDNQSKLGVDDLKAAAKSLGADSTKFDKCLDDNATIAKVEKDIQEGTKLGVKSTPTFYVNGQLVAGALPLDTFSEIIDEELAK